MSLSSHPFPPLASATDPGSRHWLQHLVAHAPQMLQPRELPWLQWLSPVREDLLRLYADDAFLARLGLGALGGPLAGFWPRGGPAWDGLARFEGGVVLVVARARVADLLQPAPVLEPGAMGLVCDSLFRVKHALGVAEVCDWTQVLGDHAIRLAHLWWLRERGVDAKLLQVCMLGDPGRRGPASPEVWAAAQMMADHALGLPSRHRLSPHILTVHPDLRRIAPHLRRP